MPCIQTCDLICWPNQTHIVCAQWLGYYAPNGASAIFLFEEAILKLQPESMARDIGSWSIMLRGTWIPLNCTKLCITDKTNSIKCMPVIFIQVSVFLSSLPKIDGVWTIKVNPDKGIKVVWNRCINGIIHKSSLSMNILPANSGPTILAHNLQQTCHSELRTQTG